MSDPVHRGLLESRSHISKRAVNRTNSRRLPFRYESARAAIGAFFRASDTSPDATILCPAYLGWSPKEGSGVLDPLKELGFQVLFYRVTASLGIDTQHLAELLAAVPVSAVIIIPFLGRVPDGYHEAAAQAR